MSPTSERLRLATWNCFGVPTSAEDFAAGRPFWPERLVSPAVLATLGTYDVVCVQENFMPRVRESLEWLRAAGGFAELWSDPMGPDGETRTFVGGGLAILSRFPLAVRFARLAPGAGPDGFARKGLAVAEITLPSGRVLRVLNAHLQADDDMVPLAESRRIRAAQLAGIAAALGAGVASGDPVVLTGDFNVPHGTDEYDEMRRALGHDLVDLAARAGLVTYDVAGNDLAARFRSGGPDVALYDYILTSPSRVDATEVRTLLVEPLADLAGRPPGYEGRAFASDHYGVGATLTFG